MVDYPYLNNTTADIRLLGAPNFMSPFCQFNSASRVNMFNHHLSQTMIINEPEFNKIFTGEEHNVIDYTFSSSKLDHRCEIVEIIPKYKGPLVSRDICPEVYVITLTLDEPDGKPRLDYFMVNRYFMGTKGFGWIPDIHNRHLVVKGEILEKDETIVSSPAVKGNQYCYGVNLNVALGSWTETVEDSFVISESAARKMGTVEVSKINIVCRMDRRPLNINGNEDEDKFLPDIGELVRPDGMLCAFRPVHWTTVVSDTDPASLREPLPLQDDIIYIEPGSRIVDLTFNINNTKLKDCYDQARNYQRNNTKCWEDIYATYLRYKGKHKLTKKMSTLIRTAMYRMIAQGARIPSPDPEFQKAAKNPEIEGINGHVVDFMEVEVTYVAPRPVSKGTKITDQQGSKGVIGAILPDDWMPVDEHGIRADLMIDMNSPVGRNNPGQLYEMGINRISEFVRRKVEQVLKTDGSEPAFEVLMDWYNDVNPNYAKLIIENDTTSKSRRQTVEEAVKMGPRIWIPPFLNTLTPNKEDFWNALENISNWGKKWGVTSTPVRYKSLQADGSGKEFVTEAKFAIGSKYVLHLHKIPEQFAPGPAAVNHIGIPTKTSYDNKHYPVSTNPYRYGEDELRIMAMDTPTEEVTRFQALLSNSPTGVNKTIESILLADHPTRIRRIPISNGQLQKTNAVNNLFHKVTASLGVETKSTADTGNLMSILGSLNDNGKLAESIYQSAVIDIREERSSGEDGEDDVKRPSSKKAKVQKMIALLDNEDEDADDILDEVE